MNRENELETRNLTYENHFLKLIENFFVEVIVIAVN